MPPRVVFSNAAKADLHEIDDFTIEHFGIDQAIKTAAHFKEVLEALVEMPGTGQLRPEISPAGRELKYRSVLGAFILVYEPSESGIRVARVIHGARNLVAELDRDPGDD